MPKKLRLTDLYKVGEEMTFHSEEGKVTVWVQKPNDVQIESIYRRANAAKARYLMTAQDEDSEEYQEAWGIMSELEEVEDILIFALNEELNRAKARATARIEADERWSKDDFLQSLFDAWLGDEENPGLHRTYALDPEDPEALRVFDALREYEEAVNEAFNAERDHLKAEYADEERSKLLDMAARGWIQINADGIQTRELIRQQTFYSVRDKDKHAQLYFGTVAEVDDLPQVIRDQLTHKVTEFILEVAEGKGTAATPDSSLKSEQPETADASSDSGPEGVAA